MIELKLTRPSTVILIRRYSHPSSCFLFALPQVKACIIIQMRHFTGHIMLRETYHWGQGYVHNKAGTEAMQFMEGNREVCLGARVVYEDFRYTIEPKIRIVEHGEQTIYIVVLREPTLLKRYQNFEITIKYKVDTHIHGCSVGYKDRPAPRQIHGAARAMGGFLLDDIVFCGRVCLLRMVVSTSRRVNNNRTSQR